MRAPLQVTRRGLFGRILQAFAAARIASSLALAASFESDGASARSSAAAGKANFRRYRVQAAVNLFGVPVFWKDGVGAAGLLVEEAATGVLSSTAVQFVSGSWPERIKGFNRFGMTQEIVHEENGVVRESGYLSFMTSSPEKNSDQAWRAFTDRPRNLTLAVSCGLASGSGYRWALERQAVPAESTWMDCPSLMEKFRRRNVALEDGGLSSAREQVYPTFLISVRKAALRRADGRCAFIHNAKLYDLHTRFSEAGGVVLLIGRIAEQGSSNDSEFRVWFDSSDPSGLPNKIELRPKSFLHLTFHQDSAAGGPSVRRLVVPEEA
jgi:hypothetical protein